MEGNEDGHSGGFGVLKTRLKYEIKKKTEKILLYDTLEIVGAHAHKALVCVHVMCR